jgi:hypothetical protein
VDDHELINAPLVISHESILQRPGTNDHLYL